MSWRHHVCGMLSKRRQRAVYLTHTHAHEHAQSQTHTHIYIVYDSPVIIKMHACTLKYSTPNKLVFHVRFMIQNIAKMHVHIMIKHFIFEGTLSQNTFPIVTIHSVLILYSSKSNTSFTLFCTNSSILTQQTHDTLLQVTFSSILIFKKIN